MSAGILDQVSIGSESQVNTAVVPTVSIAVLASDGINTVQEAVGVEGIDTQPGLNKGFVPGTREYDGAYSMNAYPQAIGYFLKSALGNSDSDTKAGETIVYEHSFSESGEKSSLTVEEKNGDITNRYAGFIASTLGIEITPGEAIKFNVTGKGMSKAAATAITPAYETSIVFDWSDVQSITLGGTDIKCAISSLSLEYTNGLDSFHGVCSQEPSALFVGNSEVTGSIEAYLTSNMAALETVFENTTEQALVITIQADETIGSTSHNELILTIPKVILTSFSTPLDTSYVKVTADIAARVDSTDGLITAQLTNLVANY